MGYNKLRITTLSIWLGELVIGLLLVMLIHGKLIEVQQAVTILVAMVTASIGWFVTLRMKARLDLQAKASDELIKSVSEYSEALRDFYYGISLLANVSPPKPAPSNFWYNSALQYYQKLGEKHATIANAHTKFRESIEANEMALVVLKDYYDYVKFKHDDLMTLLNAFTEKAHGLLNGVASEQAFVQYVNMYYSEIAGNMAEQLMTCLDLKREVLNEFQASIFGYKLDQRKPLNSAKILRQLATEKKVAEMRKKREDEFTQVGAPSDK